MMADGSDEYSPLLITPIWLASGVTIRVPPEALDHRIAGTEPAWPGTEISWCGCHVPTGYSVTPQSPESEVAGVVANTSPSAEMASEVGPSGRVRGSQVSPGRLSPGGSGFSSPTTTAGPSRCPYSTCFPFADQVRNVRLEDGNRFTVSQLRLAPVASEYTVICCRSPAVTSTATWLPSGDTAIGPNLPPDGARTGSAERVADRRAGSKRSRNSPSAWIWLTPAA